VSHRNARLTPFARRLIVERVSRPRVSAPPVMSSPRRATRSAGSWSPVGAPDADGRFVAALRVPPPVATGALPVPEHGHYRENGPVATVRMGSRASIWVIVPVARSANWRSRSVKKSPDESAAHESG
jgi:hypothetical protein